MRRRLTAIASRDLAKAQAMAAAVKRHPWAGKLFEDGKAVGVRAQFGDQEVDLRSQVVVDATGRNTLIGNQLKIIGIVICIKDQLFFFFISIKCSAGRVHITVIKHAM